MDPPNTRSTQNLVDETNETADKDIKEIGCISALKEFFNIKNQKVSGKLQSLKELSIWRITICLYLVNTETLIIMLKKFRINIILKIVYLTMWRAVDYQEKYILLSSIKTK